MVAKESEVGYVEPGVWRVPWAHVADSPTTEAGGAGLTASPSLARTSSVLA